MERERPNPGNTKCLDPAMPEASDIPENLAYINQLICLSFFFLNHNQESRIPGKYLS